MRRIQRLALTGLVGAALAAGGCGSNKPEANKKEAKKEAPSKEAGGDKAGPTDLAAKPEDQPAEDAPAELDERVVKAASLAKEIEAEPEKTDAILEGAGMDRESFEALIYEVSRPELAEQYRLAMAREG